MVPSIMRMFESAPQNEPQASRARQQNGGYSCDVQLGNLKYTVHANLHNEDHVVTAVEGSFALPKEIPESVIRAARLSIDELMADEDVSQEQVTRDENARMEHFSRFNHNPDGERY